MNTYRLSTAATFFILFLPRGYAWSTHTASPDEPAKPHAVRQDAAATAEERARRFLLAGRTKPPSDAELGEVAAAAEKDESPVVRESAVHALGEWAKWYVDLLELREKFRFEPDSDEKLAAQAVLEKAGLTEETFTAFGERFAAVATALTKSLKSEKDPEVLKETIQSLSKAPRVASRLAPTLLRLMESGDVSLHAAAEKLAKSLPTPPASSVPQLIPFLNGKDLEARYLAFKWLAALKEASAPAVPQLTAALQDPASGIRDAAIGALGAVGPAAKDSVTRLHGILKKSGRDAALQNTLLQALGNIGPGASEANRDIADLAYTADTAPVALEALGKIAPTSPASLEAIRQAIVSKDPGTRAAAITPLGQAVLASSQENNHAELQKSLHQLKQVLLEDPLAHLRNRAAGELGKVLLVDPKAARGVDIPVVALGEVALASIPEHLQKRDEVPAGLVDLVAMAITNAPASDRFNLLKKLDEVFRGRPSLPFSPALAEAVLRSMDSKELRERFLARELVAGWCTIYDRKVIPVLIKVAQNPTGEFAREAARQLAGIIQPGDEGAAPAIARNFVQHSLDDGKLGGALKKLGAAGSRAMEQVLSDPDPDLRFNAIYKVAGDPVWGDALLDKIVSHVDDPSRNVRLIALQALIDTKRNKPEYLKKILESKGEPNEEMRSWVALAIAKAGGAKTELPWLLDRSREPSATVRFRTAFALGYSDDPRAQRRLVELTADPDFNTRRAAIDSLSKFAPNAEIVRGLTQAMSDPTVGDRAANALSKWGPISDSAIPRALEILDGQAERQSKADALSFLGSRRNKAKEFMPVFQRALKEPDELLNRTALNALGGLDREAAPATPQVIEWLASHPKEWPQYQALALQILTDAGPAANRETDHLSDKLADLFNQTSDAGLKARTLLALSGTSGVEKAAELIGKQNIERQSDLVAHLPIKTKKLKQNTQQLLTHLSRSDDGVMGELASRQLNLIKNLKADDEP